MSASAKIILHDLELAGGIFSSILNVSSKNLVNFSLAFEIDANALKFCQVGYSLMFTITHQPSSGSSPYRKF